MDEELVRGIARMIEATLNPAEPEDWVPINRYVVPSQEVPTAPPSGPGLN